VATPRSVFLSYSSSIPRFHLSPPTLHIYRRRRPHVTTHRSRSEVSSSSSTTLPPCTPSTRRALLFYYSTRPRRVRLVASAYIPEDFSSPSLSLSLSLSLSSSVSLLPSSPFSHLFRATAARFSTNGETGISASNTRIFFSCCCCCCCCSLCSLPLLFCLRHLLLEARLQLVYLGFGTSRHRENPSRVILLFALPTRYYRDFVAEKCIFKIHAWNPERNRNYEILELMRFVFETFNEVSKKKSRKCFQRKCSLNRCF